MATRGRPAKVLTLQDRIELEKFLADLAYLKKNQKLATSLLHSKEFSELDEKDLKLLKIVHREKIQFEQRQALIAQIQLKQRNQQQLLANEIEILQLLEKEQDQDTFFRLDRALESYQKIEKAALDNRIRLENEHKREILQKSHKELTEAQKKRNAENQLKYALGGMLQSLYKNLGISITQSQIPLLEQALVQTLIWEKVTKNTKIYKAVEHNTIDINEARELFHRILEDLPTYKLKEQEFHTVLINKHRK